MSRRPRAAVAVIAAVAALAGCGTQVHIDPVRPTSSTPATTTSRSAPSPTHAAESNVHGSGTLAQLPALVQQRIHRSAVAGTAFGSDRLQFEQSASVIVVGDVDADTVGTVTRRAVELLPELEGLTGRRPTDTYLILIARDQATAAQWGRKGQGQDFTGLTFGGRSGSTQYVLLPGYLKTTAGAPRLSDPRALTEVLRYQLFLANALPDGGSYLLDPRWIISGFPAWYAWRGLSWEGPSTVRAVVPTDDDFTTASGARWVAALFVDRLITRFGQERTMKFLLSASYSPDVADTFQQSFGQTITQAQAEWAGQLASQRRRIAAYADEGYGLDGPGPTTT